MAMPPAKPTAGIVPEFRVRSRCDGAHLVEAATAGTSSSCGLSAGGGGNDISAIFT